MKIDGLILKHLTIKNKMSLIFLFFILTAVIVIYLSIVTIHVYDNNLKYIGVTVQHLQCKLCILTVYENVYKYLDNTFKCKIVYNDH